MFRSVGLLPVMGGKSKPILYSEESSRQLQRERVDGHDRRPRIHRQLHSAQIKGDAKNFHVPKLQVVSNLHERGV